MTGHPAWIALCVLASVVGPARAERRITVHGVVRRADNRTPIPAATVLIKSTAMAGADVLARAVTGKDGAFTADVTVVRPRFVCEAAFRGMTSQRAAQSIDTPTCELELESELELSDVVRQSPSHGGGPALSFYAHTADSLFLASLTVRLHLKKPDSCGSPGEVQLYKLDGKLVVSFGQVTGTITSGANGFTIAGTAPLRLCEKTTISLVVEPATTLPSGKTAITVALPSSLMLTKGAAQRAMSLTQLGASARYRSTIEQIDVELVTSRDGKAFATLPGIAIPVSVGE
jgi:hypothetical protein